MHAQRLPVGITLVDAATLEYVQPVTRFVQQRIFNAVIGGLALQVGTQGSFHVATHLRINAFQPVLVMIVRHAAKPEHLHPCRCQLQPAGRDIEVVNHIARRFKQCLPAGFHALQGFLALALAGNVDKRDHRTDWLLLLRLVNRRGIHAQPLHLGSSGPAHADHLALDGFAGKAGPSPGPVRHGQRLTVFRQGFPLALTGHMAQFGRRYGDDAHGLRVARHHAA